MLQEGRQKKREYAHTITIMPDTSNKPKTFAKRDVVIATKKHKEKFQKEKARQSGKGYCRRPDLTPTAMAESLQEGSSKRKGKSKRWQCPLNQTLMRK